MTEYRRHHVPGAAWFLVNLAERKGNHLLVDRIDALRWLRLETVVVLPDHSLHCIWTLAPGCDEYSTFSRANNAHDALCHSLEQRPDGLAVAPLVGESAE